MRGEWGRANERPDGPSGNPPSPRPHPPGNLMAQFYLSDMHISCTCCCYLPALMPTSLRPSHHSGSPHEGRLPCGPTNLLLAEYNPGSGRSCHQGHGAQKGLCRQNRRPMPHTKSGQWYVPSALDEMPSHIQGAPPLGQLPLSHKGGSYIFTRGDKCRGI